MGITQPSRIKVFLFATLIVLVSLAIRGLSPGASANQLITFVGISFSIAVFLLVVFFLLNCKRQKRRFLIVYFCLLFFISELGARIVLTVTEPRRNSKMWKLLLTPGDTLFYYYPKLAAFQPALMDSKNGNYRILFLGGSVLGNLGISPRFSLDLS